MDWNKAYGPDADLFPVKVGDVWECGEAVMACLDLETPMLERFWEGRKFQMVYADPPWGAGNARSFRTKAGVGRPVDFNNLISRILSVVKKSEGAVWVEMGIKAQTQVSGLMTAEGAILKPQIFEIKYYNKHPCLLMRTSFVGGEVVLGNGPSGLDETPATVWAIENDSRPGQIIADPCLGRGLIPEEAIRRGRGFIGSELNPRRMSVALAKVSRISGGTPRKIMDLEP